MLSFLIDVFALGERLFSRPMSTSSDARDVSSAGCGSKASDWLKSFVHGGEETQNRVDQLGFASNGLSNPSSFTLYIGL